MSEPIRYPDELARHRRQEAAQTFETDIGEVLTPCRPPEPLTTPARLGQMYRNAARRAGCEDAYDNEIQVRYGDGY